MKPESGPCEAISEKGEVATHGEKPWSPYSKVDKDVCRDSFTMKGVIVFYEVIALSYANNCAASNRLLAQYSQIHPRCRAWTIEKNPTYSYIVLSLIITSVQDGPS